MASPAAVATALAYLHELYPTRPISDATLSAWTEAMRAVPDDELLPAARRCSVEVGRKFFPTPGELLAYVHTPRTLLPDADAVLREIEWLGSYSPQVGWVLPSRSKISDRFGGHIAEVVSSVGVTRLYSNNETTRDIARSQFAKSLHEAHEQAERAGLPLARPALTTGDDAAPSTRSVIASVAASL